MEWGRAREVAVCAEADAGQWTRRIPSPPVPAGPRPLLAPDSLATRAGWAAAAASAGFPRHPCRLVRGRCWRRSYLFALAALLTYIIRECLWSPLVLSSGERVPSPRSGQAAHWRAVYADRVPSEGHGRSARNPTTYRNSTSLD